ncbi:putative non-specific serine/threonine protein kinase [Helianthus anomalus]
MDISTLESFQYDFSIVKAATNDFSIENKLGWGGFGAVYKVWNNLKLSLELNAQ